MLYRIILISSLFIFIIGCGKNEDKKQEIDKTVEISEKVIRKIPETISFINAEDKTVKLEEYKKRIIVINFWASWVVDTRTELENINKLYNEFKTTRFKLFSVSLDDIYSKEFIDYKNKLNVDFDVYSVTHNSEIIKVFPEIKEKIPCTFILDDKLNLIEHYKGNIEPEKVKQKLIGLLNE